MDFKNFQDNDGAWEVHVIVHNDHSNVKYLNSKSFGYLILNDDASTHFDLIQPRSSLQSVLYLTDNNDYSEIYETVKHIKVRKVTNNIYFCNICAY